MKCVFKSAIGHAVQVTKTTTVSTAGANRMVFAGEWIYTSSSGESFIIPDDCFREKFSPVKEEPLPLPENAPPVSDNIAFTEVGEGIPITEGDLAPSEGDTSIN